jgi:hypothetical protein
MPYFSYYLLCFFLCKIGEYKGRTGSAGGQVALEKRGRWWGKE